MSGRVQQDSFMDDSDECCPLCVEEFDLSDRSFRPCPCGYQVCQFCYNNIKTNMNGLCPACRRTYDDKNIQWKVISPEEVKADVVAQARKKAAARQKEVEKRQAETQNRKHLSGLRVLQKNLVYVVGMSIPGSGEDVLETLRGPYHFGQYGPIIKVVVSKTKEGQPLGIYVTFVNKEDAASCISALDSVSHDGRTLRAQYGTTKYCSAFLRNETCNNRSCMFLHETGEDNESFSRQDLSSFNALSSQRSAASNKQDLPRPPVSTQQPAQGSNHSSSAPANNLKADAMSRSDSEEGSALPTTASWARNPQLEQSKKSGTATSRSTPSPKTAQAKTTVSRPQSRAAQSVSSTSGRKESAGNQKPEAAQSKPPVSTAKPAPKLPAIARMEEAIRQLTESPLTWTLDRSLFDAATLAMIDNCPPLIDPNAGARRFALRVQQERERATSKEYQKDPTQPSEDGDALISGSLQLGGEPDTVDESAESRILRPFGTQQSALSPFDNQASMANDFSSLLGGRSLTPHQQQNISLLKGGSSDADSGFEQFSRPVGNTNQHQSQLSNPFQSQSQQFGASPRHGRQSSRYTFSNDAGSASASIKPIATSQMMMQQQQSNAMSGSQSKGFGGQNQMQPGIYTNTYSNIQGPPPGLKSAGTPPISGGGMFGQGHGFTSGLGALNNFAPTHGGSKGNNEDILRDAMRGRGAAGAAEVGKLDLSDPSILQARMHHTSVGQSGYGSQGQDQQDEATHLDQTASVDTPTKFGSESTTPSAQVRMSLASLPGLPLAEFPPLSTVEGLTATVAQDRKHSSWDTSKATSLDEISQKLPLTSPREPSIWQPIARPITKAIDIVKKVMAEPQQSDESGKVGSSSAKQDQKLPELDTGSVQRRKRNRGGIATTSATIQKGESVEKDPPSGSSPIQPPIPATVVSQSPASTVRQPRTLRLIQPPKTETASPTDTPSETPVTRVSRQHSRERTQSLTQVPSTPIKEQISEHASVASNSASRPASPWHDAKSIPEASQPRSKAQKKKERQAKAKQVEETKPMPEPQKTTPVEELLLEEVIQAPVIGRKKKAKKPQRQNGARVVSEATIDQPEFAEQDTGDAVAEAVIETPTEIDSTLESNQPAVVDEPLEHVQQEPGVKDLPSSGAVISYLKDQGGLDSGLFDAFLKPDSLHYRSEGFAPPNALDGWDFKLSRSQRKSLDSNDAVIVRLSGHEHGIILPDLSICRYLSLEEAQKYVRLRDDIFRDDPCFLSNANLPFCGKMDSTWSEATKLVSTNGLQLPAPGDSEEYVQPPEDDGLGGTNDSSAVLGGRVRYVVDGLIGRVEDTEREDAEDALKTSEEVMYGARKAAELEEKRFNAALKRNRKIINTPA